MCVCVYAKASRVNCCLPSFPHHSITSTNTAIVLSVSSHYRGFLLLQHVYRGFSLRTPHTACCRTHTNLSYRKAPLISPLSYLIWPRWPTSSELLVWVPTVPGQGFHLYCDWWLYIALSSLPDAIVLFTSWSEFLMISSCCYCAHAPSLSRALRLIFFPSMYVHVVHMSTCNVYILLVHNYAEAPSLMHYMHLWVLHM